MVHTLFDGLDSHLTTGFDRTTESALRRTYAGQAHFAATGPDGKTCRECEHWRGGEYYAVRCMGGSNLKPAPCRKRQRLMNTSTRKPVPHNAAACRFFEVNEAGAPAIQQPR